MRKALGLLFATSLLIPVGITAAGSAGAAAAKGPTCKTFSSTLTASVGLPPITSTAKVHTTETTVGKIGGCTGGPVPGVTGATISATSKYFGNCITFLSGKGGVTTPAKPTSTLTWTNHKTSTVITTSKLLTPITAKVVKVQLTTKFIAGQYVGATQTGVAISKSPAGSCTKIPGKTTTLSGSGTFTFK